MPSPGHLPNPGIKPGSPALQVDSLPSELPGKPQFCIRNSDSKASAYNVGDPGSIPGPGQLHMLQGNEAHVPQLLSPCPIADAPQQEKP